MVKKTIVKKKTECPVMRDEMLSLAKKRGYRGLQSMRKQELFTFLKKERIIPKECKRPSTHSITEIRSKGQKKFQPKRIGKILSERRKD